jgi:nicotinate-nucleotide adenylyltransferase
MKKIGLIGGSFDPIHNAHLALAASAVSELALDEIRFIPAGDPWQKRDRAVTAASHRLAMVQRALGGSAYVADDCEIVRAAQTQGPTYTIDTLKALRERLPNTLLVWLVGSDAFARLDSWHEWRALFSYAHFAVAVRGQNRDWQQHMSTALADEFQKRRALNNAINTADGHIYLLQMPASTISSTQVRDCAKRGDQSTLKILVPAPVLDYITTHQLYR